MAQGFVVPFPQRIFDASGVPAVAYRVYTFASGSSTPINTWSNADLSSLNTNPVITDASGFLRIFVAAGTLIKIAVHDAADALLYSLDLLEPMVDPTVTPGNVTAVPTGGIIAWSTSTPPAGGFLLCDGTAVSRATYSTLDALYSAAAYPFGAGNGTTTFNVPDLRGKFPLGQATAGTGAVLGSTGGAIDHTHTGPSHTHSVVVTRDGWGATLNTPSSEGRVNTGAAAGTGQFNSSYQPTADLTVTSAAGGTGATGTENPPFVALQFIVKT